MMTKIYLLCLTETPTIYWMQMQLWMQDDFLNMGIFIFENTKEDEDLYREFYINHIDAMMNEVQRYNVNWNASIEEIVAALLAEQLIFAYEGQYIAIYDATNQDISKLDLFLDVYQTQIFQEA